MEHIEKPNLEGIPEKREKDNGKEMLKLRGIMAENKKTQQDLANFLGCSAQTISKKINGKIPFDCWEVKEIKELFQLSAEECVQIFLS